VETGEGCLLRAFDSAESAKGFLAQHLAKQMPSGRHAMRKARIALARRLAIIACHATTRV
jgi:hypothetical protein